MALNVSNRVPVRFRLLQYDEGPYGFFSTSQDISTTPTRYLGDTYPPEFPNLKKGVLQRIHYWLKPTALETFTLRLWMGGAALGSLSAQQLLNSLIFESAAAKVGNTRYEEPNVLTGTYLKIPFTLLSKGKLYYSVQWTGAPGPTLGYVDVYGLAYEF
jgi:hypothetical protein